MANNIKYTQESLEKLSIEAIQRYKLFFIDDIIAYLPCSRATFYNHGLDKLDTIKDALTQVRTEIKVSMRSKWYKSDNPTLQMGLMKLIASPDELRQLSMNHVESVNKHQLEDFDIKEIIKFK